MLMVTCLLLVRPPLNSGFNWLHATIYIREVGCEWCISFLWYSIIPVSPVKKNIKQNKLLITQVVKRKCAQ